VAGYEYAPAGQVEWKIDNNAPPGIPRAVMSFMTIQAFLFKPDPMKPPSNISSPRSAKLVL
jgi:hypothetical protein